MSFTTFSAGGFLVSVFRLIVSPPRARRAETRRGEISSGSSWAMAPNMMQQRGMFRPAEHLERLSRHGGLSSFPWILGDAGDVRHALLAFQSALCRA
jgi:hypothetical protein